MESKEISPQSKRHSYPVMLTYTETLSVLSEHQREYNRQGTIKRSKTPTLIQGGTDEERRLKLQQALDWLNQELKDMHHQDKFLLRQFHYLNRSIQELKEKQESKAENETKPSQNAREKPNQFKNNRKTKPEEDSLQKETRRTTQKQPVTEVIIHGKFKLEDLKQAQLKHAQKRQAELKNEEDLSKQGEIKQEKRSLNGYDSDYGSESSDQSLDKFEVECVQPKKNNGAFSKSLKASSKQQRTKRWSWWK